MNHDIPSAFPIIGKAAQDAIGGWGDETFGGAGFWSGPLRHFLSEANELREAFQAGEVEQIPGELADCAILLFQIAHRCGLDLSREIVRKHEINTGRTWAHDPALGFSVHVEPPAEDPG